MFLRPRHLQSAFRNLANDASGEISEEKPAYRDDQDLNLYHMIHRQSSDAEKLVPILSSPDGTKALFHAPVKKFPAVGESIIRVQRAECLAPQVVLRSEWLHVGLSK